MRQNQSPTLQAILATATLRLTSGGIASPRLDAEVLLRTILGIDRTRLFLRLPEPAPAEVIAPYEALIARRLAGEPVAYIVGQREFMGLPFHVAPGVLVPRPETELLVERALGWLSEHPDSAVIDVGTGSGAIALSIAANLPPSSRAMVIASDPSIEALRIAIRNRQALSDRGIVEKVVFVQQSLLTETTGEVDLVLANLPYLTPEQIAENTDLDAEPRLALDGGEDGLDLVRALIDDLPRVLAADGAAGFELDPSQTDTVVSLLAGRFPGCRTRVIADLAGLPRHVVMTRDHDS
ncbi:MAG: peptide chain release factor N(5)-glutamine methyltransferase [Thermomicrobiales bacterium]